MPAAKKRPILQGIEHGTTGYRKGCGCAKCRGAKAAERADERKRATERKRAQVVQDDPAPDARPVAPAATGSPLLGAVGQAVADELAQHEGAIGVQSMAAVALALAQEIDERATPSIAGASSTLLRYLTEIRKASRQVDGELAELLDALGESP